MSTAPEQALPSPAQVSGSTWQTHGCLRTNTCSQPPAQRLWAVCDREHGLNSRLQPHTASRLLALKSWEGGLSAQVQICSSNFRNPQLEGHKLPDPQTMMPALCPGATWPILYHTAGFPHKELQPSSAPGCGQLLALQGRRDPSEPGALPPPPLTLPPGWGTLAGCSSQSRRDPF